MLAVLKETNRKVTTRTSDSVYHIVLLQALLLEAVDCPHDEIMIVYEVMSLVKT